MRVIKRTAALSMCLATVASAFLLPALPTYADEQKYLTEEPTITVDADAKKATVSFILQDKINGIKDASYNVSWLEPDDNGDNLGYGNMSSDSRLCAAGTSLSCLEQFQKPMPISYEQTNMKDGVVYTIDSISIAAEDGTETDVPGHIKFSLDGITENTIEVATAPTEPTDPDPTDPTDPTNPEEPEDVISPVIEEPVITIDQEAKTAVIEIVIQDAENGINKEYSYEKIDELDNPSGTMPYSARIGGGFECAAGTGGDCRLEPVGITASFSNLEEGHTYGIKNLRYKNNNGEQVDVEGVIRFRLNEGVIEQTMFTAGVDDPTGGELPTADGGEGATPTPANPKTDDDIMFIVIPAVVVLGFGAIVARRELMHRR